ncbi:uncharacterized protein [Apostichopus japonicus]|uniref:uncharacterized protein isoform X2 n=1 Tax=Stichopus japonicus TaxID=307972 RepID=UPI003AB10DF6
MLAEYPSDYCRPRAVPAVHVQQLSPTMSDWSAVEHLPSGEKLSMLAAGEFSNMLYYERFQDGCLHGLLEDEDDDDDDIEDVAYSACTLEETISSEGGLYYEIQSPTRSPDIICGSDDSDYLHSTFMSLLPEHHLLGEDLPLMPDLVPKNQNPLREEATSVDHLEEKLPIDVSSRKRKLQGVAWKNLSQREKQETVEELLATISYTLGPRERLEVARILDTDGDISGVSYVLSIDPENLPEEKVTLIQNLLEEATDDAKTRDWRHMQQERSSKVKRESTSKGILPKSRMQKSGNTLRRNLSRLTRERQRKEECRQDNKEKKSGFFEKEQVISLYQDGSSDEEEVDILE